MTVDQVERPRTLVRIGTAAARLGVHRDTVRGMVKRGALPAYQFGDHGHLRFDVADLDAVLRPVAVGRAV